MQQSNEPRGTPGSTPAGSAERGDWTFEPASGATSARTVEAGGAGSDAAPDTWSPEGDEYSSSSSPIGEGSNTPVGGEPDAFRAWDARQPEPGQAEGAFGMLSQGPGQALPWGAGLAATGAAGWAAYSWWRQRQARKSRLARARRALVMAGLAAGSRLPKDFSRDLSKALSKDVPKRVGTAVGKARSPWAPFALLPLALWLQAQGGKSARAGEELLEPLDLEDRSTRLARQAAELVERKGRRAIRENQPFQDTGWGWWPWLLAIPVVGGLYVAARRWMDLGGFGGGGSVGLASSGQTVREVMTRGVEVIGPDASLAEAARKMRDLNVGSLPVVDGERLLGVVTDRDLSVRATAEGKDPNATKIRQVMSPEVTWVFEDEPADMAASMMRQRQIRRLPVLDRNDKLVGIVALADLATDLGDDRLKGETLEQISQPGRGNGR